jgi:hypothetical protein
MSRLDCPGAVSGDSSGQNQPGSRARSETIPKGQRARAGEVEGGVGSLARARPPPVKSGVRAGSPGRRAMTGRTEHEGDPLQRGHRGCESDRTARASKPSAVRCNPAYSGQRVPPENEMRGMPGPLPTSGPRLYASMANSPCEARCAGRCSPVYTLVSQWMFPRAARTGFQSTFELRAGTICTGERGRGRERTGRARF